jgi:nitrate reductase beta subunit
MRIPAKYLANLLTAGNVAPVYLALSRMLAMRNFMRGKHVEGIRDLSILEKVGLSENMVNEMYRYMAIANYEDRFVIPTSHSEYAGDAFGTRSGCGFNAGNCSSNGDNSVDVFGKTQKINFFGGNQNGKTTPTQNPNQKTNIPKNELQE